MNQFKYSSSLSIKDLLLTSLRLMFYNGYLILILVIVGEFIATILESVIGAASDTLSGMYMNFVLAFPIQIVLISSIGVFLILFVNEVCRGHQSSFKIILNRLYWGKLVKFFIFFMFFGIVVLSVFLGSIDLIGLGGYLISFIIIPIIYFWVVFVPQALVIEGKGIWASFKQSKKLAKGNWWRIAFITVLFIIFSSLLDVFFDMLVTLGLFVLNLGRGFEFTIFPQVFNRVNEFSPSIFPVLYLFIT